MARYIDVDLDVSQYVTVWDCDCSEFGKQTVMAVEDLQYLPTADVVEVRHGTWYHGTDNGAVYAKCSACGRKMNYSCYGYAYCALCGAKMDSKRSENGK